MSNVTSGSTWRSRNYLELTFPSGATALIRTVSTDLFIRLGRIPDFASPYIIDAIENGGGIFDIRKLPERVTIEDERNWIEFLNAVTELAFVSPKIVDNPTSDDEISVDDVEYSDKLYIAAFLGRPVQSLSAFFEKQKAIVETLSTKPTNTPLAVQNS